MPFIERVVTPTFLSRSTKKFRKEENPDNDAIFSCSPSSKLRSSLSDHQHKHHHQQQQQQHFDNGSGKPFSSHHQEDIFSSISATHSINSFSGSNDGILLVNGNDCSSSSITTTTASCSGGGVLGESRKPIAAEISRKNEKSFKWGMHRNESSSKNCDELERIANITLSNALRQLATVLVFANDIFCELKKDLGEVGDRSQELKEKIARLENKIGQLDAKAVPIPEGDLMKFAQMKTHFISIKPIDQHLFTTDTRSMCMKLLHRSAGNINTGKSSDNHHHITANINYNGDTLDCTSFDSRNIIARSSNIAQEKGKKSNFEIEICLPEEIGNLRKWTSVEAFGNLTVTPDCTSQVRKNSTLLTTPPASPNSRNREVSRDETVISSSVSAEDCNEIAEYILPSPEEKLTIIAQKLPSTIVSVDVSGKNFDRMCILRKSKLKIPVLSTANTSSEPVENAQEIVVSPKRTTKGRKNRGKRRNTIAGVDNREIVAAACSTTYGSSSPDYSTNECKMTRSKSNDSIKMDKNKSVELEKNNTTTMTKFNSLRLWAYRKLKSPQTAGTSNEKKSSTATTFSCSNEMSNEKKSTHLISPSKTKKWFSSSKDKKSSSSEKTFSFKTAVTSCNVSDLSAADCASIDPVKLRVSASLKRQNRNLTESNKEEPYSSSGNWSASSESGRASVGSEITILPKSSASSCSLLQNQGYINSAPPSSSTVPSRRRFLNTSASSSVASEGTATPDFQDRCYDDETSSAFSCDTEGYYTSFHVDSGLKTLKEEESITPVQSISALSISNSFLNISNQTLLNVDGEYEQVGHGSTSTTNSSAGTICTILAPLDITERKQGKFTENDFNGNISSFKIQIAKDSIDDLDKTFAETFSSLEKCQRRDLIGKKTSEKNDGNITDENSSNKRMKLPLKSNNCSNAVDIISRNSTKGGTTYIDLDTLEYSDLESFDRFETIKEKTAISSSKIPGICVITPTTSDDETTKSNEIFLRNIQQLNNNDEKVITPLSALQNLLEIHSGNLHTSPVLNSSLEHRIPIAAHISRAEYASIVNFNNNNNTPDVKNLFTTSNPTKWPSKMKHSPELLEENKSTKPNIIINNKTDLNVNNFTLSMKTYSKVKDTLDSVQEKKSIFKDVEEHNRTGTSEAIKFEKEISNNSCVNFKQPNESNGSDINSITNISPIPPQRISSATGSSSSLKSSTPKLSRDDVKSQKDTKSLEVASNRLGSPKTSLIDFKKLLLAKSSKTSTSSKTSAVELLKLSKSDVNKKTTEKVENDFAVNILELSRSPKTFGRRRPLRGITSPLSSPSKYKGGNGSKLGRISTFGDDDAMMWSARLRSSNVITTAIPESNIEEEKAESNNDKMSGTDDDDEPKSLVMIDKMKSKLFPTAKEIMPENITTKYLQPSQESNVIEEPIQWNKNIFIQIEENNFMKGELLTPKIEKNLLLTKVTQDSSESSKSLTSSQKEDKRIFENNISSSTPKEKKSPRSALETAF